MAGGGTGGHVIPALAVARELRARGHIGALHRNAARHGSEAGAGRGFSDRVDRDRRVESRGLAANADRRWRSCRSACGRPRACWIALAPAAVFSTGGYVAGPVLLAALWKRVPVVVMEPNAIPGFTHRTLARFVVARAGEFPERPRVGFRRAARK